MNVNLFASSYIDMSGIDPTIIRHELHVKPLAKPAKKKPKKLTPYLWEAIKVEVDKLTETRFIRKVKHPNWIANIIAFKKPNGKVRVCIGFTDLNDACPKDNYPLSSIDKLVSQTASHEMLSLMDGNARYNQIRSAKED